jgi:T-complex protein 11
MDPPASPNDLAFFYLYDYTTPPHHSRRRFSHRRRASSHSPSAPTAVHLEKAETRRTLHLEAKRTKLATHNENIRHVLAQYKLDVGTKRLEELLDRMARADENRDRRLKLTAENCGRKVEEAKTRARRVKRERDETARVASKGILERLESAGKRREKLLSAKGKRSVTSPGRRSSRVDEQIRVKAATKIQRVWRKRRTELAVKEFNALKITVESVTLHSFEQVVEKFKSATTVRTAARLLTVLGLISSQASDKERDSLVRTFLSAYMVLGHNAEVLHSYDQPLEKVSYYHLLTKTLQGLTEKARAFVTSLESHNQTLDHIPDLTMQWETYLSAFRTWKTHDASILIDMLITKFVELDTMLLDIQDSSAMQSVVEEYSQAIKSGQMLLLTKIRRLVGDETRNMVRKAVQDGRKRRLQQRQQQNHAQPAAEEVETQEEVSEIIEPPRSEGLTNRRIMHELAINPEYEITAPVKTDEQLSREEAFKDAFYASLKTTLRNGDQSLLPAVVSDIKSRLLSLLQPSTPSYTTLSEHLDDTIVRQECQRGLFDHQNFLAYVQNTMRQLCAPIRDTDVTSIASIIGTDETDIFILRLKRINEVLSLMALDSANFHLRLARPALLSQAIVYERTKFAEELESKRITLEKATSWLQAATPQFLTERPSQPPSTQVVFRNAFVDLFFSQMEIPETFEFDTARIDNLRQRIRETITLAALVLIARTFAAGNTSRQLDWTTLTRRLSVLQNESAENILTEIDRFATCPQLKRELLLSMIRRIKSDDRDPCVMLLERRIRGVLASVLNGGEINGLTTMGLGEVETEIKDIGASVEILGRVNWVCYKEWYENIVKSHLDRAAEQN